VGTEKVYALNKYMVFAGFMSGMDTGAIVDMLKIAAKSQPEKIPAPEAQSQAAVRTKNARKPKTIRDRLKDYWWMFSTFIMLGESLGYDTLKEMRRLSKSSGAGGSDRSAFMDVYAYAARAYEKIRLHPAPARGHRIQKPLAFNLEPQRPIHL
jgi:hypothetical protein